MVIIKRTVPPYLPRVKGKNECIILVLIWITRKMYLALKHKGLTSTGFLRRIIKFSARIIINLKIITKSVMILQLHNQLTIRVTQLYKKITYKPYKTYCTS